MHILLGLLGLIVAAGVWAWRIRMAHEAVRELGNVADDVMAAARRLGFRRRTNMHPVEAVDDPSLAISALGIAFLELSGLPTAEQQAALRQSLARRLSLSESDVDERLIVGRWLVHESGGPLQAVGRLGRRLMKLDPQGWQPLLDVLNEVGQGAEHGLSPHQREALEEIAGIFRLR